MKLRKNRMLAVLATCLGAALNASAESVSVPAGFGDGALYAALSPAVAPADHAAYFPPSMRFDPDAGSLEVTFGIEEGKRVSLHAFDTQGKLLAVMLDANQEPGFHHFSLFSNRLQGQQGHVVFQLRAGQSVLAEARSRTP